MRPKTVAGSLGGPYLVQEVEGQSEEVLVGSKSAARSVQPSTPHSTSHDVPLHSHSRVPQNDVGVWRSREEAAKAAVADLTIVPTDTCNWVWTQVPEDEGCVRLKVALGPQEFTEPVLQADSTTASTRLEPRLRAQGAYPQG